MTDQTEEIPTIEIPEAIKGTTMMDQDRYHELYARSIADPEAFWAEQAKEHITWIKPWKRVLDWDYKRGHIRWFEGATLNVSSNCIDRHLETRGSKKAIIWEGNEPGDTNSLTYQELHESVCRAGNMLKSLGVKRGDRVAIYLPML